MSAITFDYNAGLIQELNLDEIDFVSGGLSWHDVFVFGGATIGGALGAGGGPWGVAAGAAGGYFLAETIWHAFEAYG